MILADMTNVAAEPGALVTYLEGLMPKLLNFGIEVLIAIIVFLVGRKLIKLVRKIVGRALERAGVETGVQQFLDSLLKAVLYFLLIVVIGTRFGVTTASVIALLGSAGLAVGLALQGSLANFAGGVLILILKPFVVGDYIVTDSGHEGTVSEIQIFYTRLLTIDNRLVVIPNGKLADCVVTNVSKMEKRRVDMWFDVAYESDLQRAQSLIRGLLENDECRLPEEEVEVFVDSLKDSSVRIGARIWVPTEEYWNVKWRLTEEVKMLFDESGIEIPYPKVSVDVKQ